MGEEPSVAVSGARGGEGGVGVVGEGGEEGALEWIDGGPLGGGQHQIEHVAQLAEWGGEEARR